ncbi:putative RING-H2 finger protein ATL71 [Oryza glaberrima]|uniref:RING-type domain-containing protein n=1 Tax=Oryza glaberrima TaxID=4538 RepID=I1QXQ8_ORYGL|nr:putative RING-H2 finger protein ATL71 [Oryza glaberrima]
MASGVSTSMVLTLLGFCGSVLFIVFVCTRLACSLLRRHRRRRRARLPAASSHFLSSVYVVDHHRHLPPSGLDPATVAAFPTRAFLGAAPRGHASASSSSSSSSDAAAQCVVCLADYEEKDVLRILPYCGHDFHAVCIDIWLMQHSTCPVCRISLCDYPDSKQTMSPLPSEVIIPPCSPEPSRSDQCNCLFVGTGHSPRTSQVLINEPDQSNRTLYSPSVEGDNNLPSSEVNPPGEINNQTMKKHVENHRIQDRS